MFTKLVYILFKFIIYVERKNTNDKKMEHIAIIVTNMDHTIQYC